jgi:hypothetical protein
VYALQVCSLFYDNLNDNCTINHQIVIKENLVQTFTTKQSIQTPDNVTDVTRVLNNAWLSKIDPQVRHLPVDLVDDLHIEMSPEVPLEEEVAPVVPMSS